MSALLEGRVKAFVYDRAISQYTLEKEELENDLVVLPNKFGVQLYGWGISENHKVLNQTISESILRITEQMEWEVVLNEYGLEKL